MGVWGPDNLANDDARDWVHQAVEKPLLDTIALALQGHDETKGHEIMAAVEVLSVLCEQRVLMPPDVELIARWRQAYLRTWEGYIDSQSPSPSFKEARRSVILNTFNRLTAVAEKRTRGQRG